MTRHASSESSASAPHPWRLRGWAAVGLTGVVLLGGCGSSSKTGTSVPNADTPALPAPSLVTAQQVNAAAPGSPQRAAVEWWQAVQYGDVLRAAALTSSSAIASVRGPIQFRQIVSYAGPSLPGFQPTGATTIGSEASVRGMELDYASPPSRRLVQQYPVSVILTKSGGRWQVDDLNTLEKLYQLVIAQQAKAAR